MSCTDLVPVMYGLISNKETGRDQVFIYVYTKEHPKEGQESPWKKGDKPLSPYAISHEETKKLDPKQKLQSNSFYDIDDDMKCQLVKRLLEKYFDNEDLTYYMNAFKREAKLCRDTWIQVIQVIQEKESSAMPTRTTSART